MLKKIVWIFPVLSGIFWGSGGVFVRYLLSHEMDSYTMIESRVLPAVLILLGWILFYDRTLLKIRMKDFWIFACTGLLGNFGVTLCYNVAIANVSLSLAAILLAISPVYVVFLAAVLFKEKITFKKIGCIVLALSGCLFASGILEEASGMKWSVYGIAVGALGGFFYALYSIFTKVAMERRYSGLTITFYSLLLIAILLIPFSDWQMFGGMIADAPLKMSLFFLVHSLCTAVLPYALYTVSIRYMEAGKASILAAGEPVAAMVFGALLFDETPTVLAIAGLMMTLAALTILSLPEKDCAERD